MAHVTKKQKIEDFKKAITETISEMLLEGQTVKLEINRDNAETTVQRLVKLLPGTGKQMNVNYAIGKVFISLFDEDKTDEADEIYDE